MITIIDYNTCNVGSIQNMLRKLGYDSVVTNNQEKIFNATKLILPGVGAFDHGINNLKELGLIPIIKYRLMNVVLRARNRLYGVPFKTNC